MSPGTGSTRPRSDPTWFRWSRPPRWWSGTAPTTRSISTACSTTTPTSAQAADHWAEEEVQHGDALGRWAMLADPGLGLRGGLRPLQGRLPAAARRRRLDPRLAHRRADRPLHGGDRHLQLLHGPGRGDATSRCCNRSAATSPPTSSAISSCSTTICAATWPREHRPAAPPAHRRRPHRRERGRRTGLRLALRQRAGGRGVSACAAAAPPTWPARWASTASAISSAAWA